MEILTGIAENVATKNRWQEELKQAFRDIDSLLAFLELDRKALPELAEAKQPFATFVPRPFANRIQKGNPRDPLLLQVVTAKSDDSDFSWSADPVEDKSFEKVPGLLHKYHGRVLLILTGACAIHCRYCFRQHFDYSTAKNGVDRALEYIAAERTISEVILSGGDPLMRTDSQLSDLVDRLNGIAHVKRIRIHTRVPVVLPSRVTGDFLEILDESRAKVCMVWHVNHGQEIDQDVKEAATLILRTGTLLLNQAVLLKAVNDNLPAQIALSEKLVDAGVLPYYLHLLDTVKGAESYFVDKNTGLVLIEQMRQQLPGYCVPKLVKEEAGEMSKTAIK